MPEEIPIPERWKLTHIDATRRYSIGNETYYLRTIQQLIEELAEAERQIKLIQTNAADNYAAAENRTHKAEEKLEALRNDVRKEFLGAASGTLANKTLRAKDDYNKGWNDASNHAVKFIHRYIAGEGLFQINPPAEQPEVEAEP